MTCLICILLTITLPPLLQECSQKCTVLTMLKILPSGATSTLISTKFFTSKLHNAKKIKLKKISASLIRNYLNGLTWSLSQTIRFTNLNSLYQKILFWMTSSWTGWILLLRLQLNLLAIFSKMHWVFPTVTSTCLVHKITATFNSYLSHLSLSLTIWLYKGSCSNFKFKCLWMNFYRRGKCTTFWIGLETQEDSREPFFRQV